MERGTDRERDAVRDQWRTLAEHRRAADRFLLGLVAAFAGSLSLLLAAGRRTCRFTVGGAAADCTTAFSEPAVLLLGLFGTLALGFGLHRCRAASTV